MTARLPSLNGLRAFEAAARHLSFTQAASELNVTQTAISHQIKRLEEELGVRLFIARTGPLPSPPGPRSTFRESGPRSMTCGWRPTACCGGTTTMC